MVVLSPDSIMRSRRLETKFFRGPRKLVDGTVNFCSDEGSILVNTGFGSAVFWNLENLATGVEPFDTPVKDAIFSKELDGIVGVTKAAVLLKEKDNKKSIILADLPSIDFNMDFLRVFSLRSSVIVATNRFVLTYDWKSKQRTESFFGKDVDRAITDLDHFVKTIHCRLEHDQVSLRYLTENWNEGITLYDVDLSGTVTKVAIVSMIANPLRCHETYGSYAAVVRDPIPRCVFLDCNGSLRTVPLQSAEHVDWDQVGVCASRNGESIALTSADRITIWHMESKIATFFHDGTPHLLRLDNSGSYAVIAYWCGENSPKVTGVLDIRSQSVLGHCYGHVRGGPAWTFSRTGHMFASVVSNMLDSQEIEEEVGFGTLVLSSWA